VRHALFRDITQRMVVIPYRHFGTPYRSHGSKNERRKPVTWGKQFIPGRVWTHPHPSLCVETSVRNYHYTLHNILEDRRSICFEAEAWCHAECILSKMCSMAWQNCVTGLLCSTRKRSWRQSLVRLQVSEGVANLTIVLSWPVFGTRALFSYLLAGRFLAKDKPRLLVRLYLKQI
jgi:hypothetical protein